MRSRQSVSDKFSTFLKFQADRFGGWVTDAKLRRSMQTGLRLYSQTESSENFWAIYWHKQWCQQQQTSQIPLGHLSAYLQEACYWSVFRAMTRLEATQHKLSDCFQVAIAEVPKILKTCDPEGHATLKTYASKAFGNIIRDLLRHSREADLCTDWGLLLKLSRKQFTEALVSAGLNSQVIERYLLAWTCFESTYLPTKSPKLRQLPPPEKSTWEAIATLYNSQRQQLKPPGEECNAKTIESWLVSAASRVRAYQYPSVKSLNMPKLGQDSGELQDDLQDTRQDSLRALIAQEEEDEREMQRSQINNILQNALANLDPTIQELLQLYYQQGLTQQQIAKQLGIQQYNVSRKLSKARETLLLVLTRWSQETLHILPTSNVIKSISTILDEWLQERLLSQ